MLELTDREFYRLRTMFFFVVRNDDSYQVEVIRTLLRDLSTRNAKQSHKLMEDTVSHCRDRGYDLSRHSAIWLRELIDRKFTHDKIRTQKKQKSR